MVKLKAFNLSAICDAMAQQSWTDRNIIEANPDIAGPGAIIGFVGTAGLVVLMTTAYYLLAFDPSKDPFHARRKGREPTQQWSPNSVDKYVFVFMTSLKRRISRLLSLETRRFSRERLEQAFVTCVFYLSDAQTLTGISILVSAYGTLETGITAYYWKMAVYLAWYANLTHQSGLTFLRAYLNDPQRRVYRTTRILMMALLTALLVAAMIPTAYFNRYFQSPEAPAGLGDYAWCFVNMPTANRMLQSLQEVNGTAKISPRRHLDDFPPLRETKSFQNMVLSVSLLVCTFGTKLCRISMRMSTFVNYSIRRHARQWAHLGLETVTGDSLCSIIGSGVQRTSTLRAFLRWHLAVKPLVALYFTGHFYLELMTSMLWEICWLWISVLFLSINFYEIQQIIPSSAPQQDTDVNIFSFGQILSIMLLAGPLLVIMTETAAAVSGDTSTSDPVKDSSRTPIASDPEPTLAQCPQERPAQQVPGKQKATIHEIDAYLPNAPAATISDGKWPACGHHHQIGSKWSVALLLFQLGYAYGTFTPFYIFSDKTLQQYPPWYFITLPSAVYFMTVVAVDAHSSKPFMIIAFVVLAGYSSGLWPLLVEDAYRFLPGAESVRVPGVGTRWLFHFLVGLCLVTLYGLCVCIMALVMRVLRRPRGGVLSGCR
ncbi:hypothetical protein B0T14DRAFT_274255 [Immersiella caudata]|uniref:Uncharacterized protein n=1 Tax=Immersiella caudata TaxID=314043 RepID=A0AA40BXY5_9PEZI|nr:hypothetical protein B0T14DRAFT_274255 [Immersiella caudata]